MATIDIIKCSEDLFKSVITRHQISNYFRGPCNAHDDKKTQEQAVTVKKQQIQMSSVNDIIQMIHLRSTVRFNLTFTFVATLHVIQLLLYFKNTNPL